MQRTLNQASFPSQYDRRIEVDALFPQSKSVQNINAKMESSIHCYHPPMKLTPATDSLNQPEFVYKPSHKSIKNDCGNNGRKNRPAVDCTSPDVFVTCKNDLHKETAEICLPFEISNKPIHVRQRSLPTRLSADKLDVANPSVLSKTAFTPIPMTELNHRPPDREKIDGYNFVIDITLRKRNCSTNRSIMSTSLIEYGAQTTGTQAQRESESGSVDYVTESFVGDLDEKQTYTLISGSTLIHDEASDQVGKDNYELADSNFVNNVYSKPSKNRSTVEQNVYDFRSKTETSQTGYNNAYGKPSLRTLNMRQDVYPFGKELRHSLKSHRDSCDKDDYSSIDPNESHIDVGRIVRLLKSADHYVVVNASACLQHLVYCNSGLKELTRQCGVIPILIQLVYSADWQICQNAVGTLRNLTCGDNLDIKEEFVRTDGIEAITWLIENRQGHNHARANSITSSSSTKEQSSNSSVVERHNEYQPALDSAVAILCNLAIDAHFKKSVLEQAVVPCLVPNIVRVTACKSILNAGELTVNQLEPAYITVFFRNAAAVLRNVSSAESNEIRESMRQCPSLLWSLITILQTAIKLNSSDTKSVEHCICTLRNLCYFVHQADTADRKQPRSKSSSGRFWWKCSNRKIPQAVTKTPESNIHQPGPLSIFGEDGTLTMLVDLLNASSNPCTLEAASRTVQNLASPNSSFGPVVRIGLRKLQCLPVLVELITTPARSVATAAADALKNLALDDENSHLLGNHAITRIIAALEASVSAWSVSIRSNFNESIEWQWPPSDQKLSSRSTWKFTPFRSFYSATTLLTALLGLCCVITNKRVENARRFITSGGLETCRQIEHVENRRKTDKSDKDGCCVEAVKQQNLRLQKILWEFTELRPIYKLVFSQPPR